MLPKCRIPDVCSMLGVKFVSKNFSLYMVRGGPNFSRAVKLPISSYSKPICSKGETVILAIIPVADWRLYPLM